MHALLCGDRSLGSFISASERHFTKAHGSQPQSGVSTASTSSVRRDAIGECSCVLVDVIATRGRALSTQHSTAQQA